MTNNIEDIKRRVDNKVNAELKLRIERGYENIELSLVGEFIEEMLKEMKVMWKDLLA